MESAKVAKSCAEEMRFGGMIGLSEFSLRKLEIKERYIAITNVPIESYFYFI
jgi:hypothetical protein